MSDPQRPARQAAFLRALKETESVSAAAAHVGMSRQSAYKLRRRMAGQPFDRGWEMAVADLRLDEALEPMAGSGRCPVCGASPARPWAAPPGRAGGDGDPRCVHERVARNLVAFRAASV
jgi:hypothetical protein